MLLLSALEIIYFFFSKEQSVKKEEWKKHAPGNELVNAKLQLLLAMGYAGPTNFRGFITTAAFLRSSATFSWGAQGNMWNLTHY